MVLILSCLSSEKIAKTDIKTLQSCISDEKAAKQILNAAKKSSKKRTADNDSASSLSKKRKGRGSPSDLSPAQVESSLFLPMSTNVEEMSQTTVVTNRAPLLLAFAVTALKYTMPGQPMSSRLSLAQAVVSANSRTKARSLGIDNRTRAEHDELAKGQPVVKVLGREISVLKRWGYDWSENAGSRDSIHQIGFQNSQSQSAPRQRNHETPAVWGLDLEASNNTKNTKNYNYNTTFNEGEPLLPIHKPEAARDYILRCFGVNPSQNVNEGKRKKPLESHSGHEKDLSLLLGAIDILCQSWASTLNAVDLDKRAWAWYVRVRPEIQDGIHGWGQKGQIPLSKILALRR